MKIAVCFIAFVIGCVYANTCSNTNPCDTSITTCGNGFTLTCKDFGVDGMHCVCVDGNGGGFTCTDDADCHGGHNHACHNGHFICMQGHCHCNGHNGGHNGGNHGQPGGK